MIYVSDSYTFDSVTIGPKVQTFKNIVFIGDEMKWNEANLL